MRKERRKGKETREDEKQLTKIPLFFGSLLCLAVACCCMVYFSLSDLVLLVLLCFLPLPVSHTQEPRANNNSLQANPRTAYLSFYSLFFSFFLLFFLLFQEMDVRATRLYKSLEAQSKAARVKARRHLAQIAAEAADASRSSFWSDIRFKSQECGRRRMGRRMGRRLRHGFVSGEETHKETGT